MNYYPVDWKAQSEHVYDDAAAISAIGTRKQLNELERRPADTTRDDVGLLV